jgi:hypothetical protein
MNNSIRVGNKEYDTFKFNLQLAFTDDKHAVVVVCKQCGFRFGCSHSCTTKEDSVEHAFSYYVLPCERCGKIDYEIESVVD